MSLVLPSFGAGRLVAASPELRPLTSSASTASMASASEYSIESSAPSSVAMSRASSSSPLPLDSGSRDEAGSPASAASGAAVSIVEPSTSSHVAAVTATHARSTAPPGSARDVCPPGAVRAVISLLERRVFRPSLGGNSQAATATARRSVSEVDATSAPSGVRGSAVRPAHRPAAPVVASPSAPAPSVNAARVRPSAPAPPPAAPAPRLMRRRASPPSSAVASGAPRVAATPPRVPVASRPPVPSRVRTPLAAASAGARTALSGRRASASPRTSLVPSAAQSIEITSPSVTAALETATTAAAATPAVVSQPEPAAPALAVPFSMTSEQLEEELTEREAVMRRRQERLDEAARIGAEMRAHRLAWELEQSSRRPAATLLSASADDATDEPAKEVEIFDATIVPNAGAGRASCTDGAVLTATDEAAPEPSAAVSKTKLRGLQTQIETLSSGLCCPVCLGDFGVYRHRAGSRDSTVDLDIDGTDSKKKLPNASAEDVEAEEDCRPTTLGSCAHSICQSCAMTLARARPASSVPDPKSMRDGVVMTPRPAPGRSNRPNTDAANISVRAAVATAPSPNMHSSLASAAAAVGASRLLRQSPADAPIRRSGSRASPSPAAPVLRRASSSTASATSASEVAGSGAAASAGAGLAAAGKPPVGPALPSKAANTDFFVLPCIDCPVCRRKNDVRYEAGQERMLPTREDVAAEDWAPKQRFVRVTTDLAFPINRDLEGAAASILKIKAAMTDLLA